MERSDLDAIAALAPPWEEPRAPAEREEQPEQPEPATAFSAVRFEAFCEKLRIDTKEMGRIPLKFLGSQRYVVEQIADGLAHDVHTFVILKGRQMGISSVMLALDLYWMFKHKGLQGAVVTDTDENREVFRSYIEQYRNSLPASVKAPIERHNRTQLVLKNGSRLVYMVAGVKKKGDLGRAKSVNYMHATECSSWGDEEGFGSLVNTLAQKNPDRLYVLESTARGYNTWNTMWEDARKDTAHCKCIFLGFWAKWSTRPIGMASPLGTSACGSARCGRSITTKSPRSSWPGGAGTASST